jgi:signal transduction histidine kinase
MATILVVDDSPTSREYLTLLLRHHGHHTLEAGDGLQALEAARAERPDLVITDILMPRLDGYELAYRLRLDPALSATRIVFHTATYQEEEARTLADALGVRHVVVKGCDPQEIARTVDAALAERAEQGPEIPAAAFHQEHLRLLTDKLSANVRRLEEEVERRRALEQELRQRLEELADADRRKDQFLMMLAHELRNPLAPMHNALRILALAATDPPAVERARGVLERQLHHLTRLVNDLLDVARITGGKIQLHKARLDLARLVRTAAEDHRPLLEGKRLALALEMPPLPLWVEGDDTRLAQVMDNLLQNAAKFTPPGGRVTVQAAADGDRAAVYVCDTGMGIEPALLPQVFDSFTQADRSLDRSPGGLGLGLSLVRGLVELHGGGVEAQSKGPGRGSRFSFRLPLAARTHTAASEVTPTGQDGRPLRILIVEDNPDTATTMRLLLELMGYEVAVAATGPAGLEATLRTHPDVVLCDIGLPGGMDGYAVARSVRSHPETARTRLIAVTGYGRDEDRRRAREAGFDLHLTKPVDPAELQRRLLPANFPT